MTSDINQVIFARTVEGQRAAFTSSPKLPADQQRLLLMLNGHTPLGDLLGLVPALDGELAVRGLVAAGLIEEVDATPAPERGELSL